MTTDKNKGGRPKGQQKYGGRKKGTPNKTTQITRQLINDLAEKMLPQVLMDIKDMEPTERVKVFIKLCEFCIPKPQTISLDMTIEKQKTIEDRLIVLAGGGKTEDF